MGVGSFPPGHDAEAPCGSRGKDPDSRTGSACFRRGPKSGRNLLPSSASADSVGACFRRGPKSGRSLPPSSASASPGGCPYRLFAPARYSVSVRSEDLPARCRSVRSSRISCKKPFCFSEACAPIRSCFLASDPWMLRFESESRKHYLSTLSTGRFAAVDKCGEGLSVALCQQPQPQRIEPDKPRRVLRS